MSKDTKMINCTDIYKEEFDKNIKILKRFREAWLKENVKWNDDLLQYADDDFYFYRFAISRQESSSLRLITNILYRVMERYKKPKESGGESFDFIINDNGIKIGYRFKDFFEDEDVNSILEKNNLDRAVIIRTWKTGKPDEWIAEDNARYQDDGIKLKAISFQDFYSNQFGKEQYQAFLAALDDYLREARENTGYQSIKILSSMNLASRKLFEEKLLAEWNYKSYKYQIIDSNNELIKNYLYILHKDSVFDDLDQMNKVYVGDKLYRTMIGTNEYAESFITSEWLYYSLKERKNFDYTSVISGYLKSIEQLLYCIVKINIDNGCKIAMNSDMLQKAFDKGIVAFQPKGKKWEQLRLNKEGDGYAFTKYPYIDYTIAQKSYMDSSIGTFEHFIRKNPHIFLNPRHSKTVADMISCFRTECRNGFFHTHNLHDWEKVEKTRDNAIYLYFVLLGSCIIPEEKKHELGIPSYDDFDNLCIRIREFRHYNLYFIFEYPDGKRQKMIYDPINNTAEYSDDGVEHYERLLFYKVDEFEGALEQLDEGIRDEQIHYLTRDNLPSRIYGVHDKSRNHELVAILS